MFEIVKKTFKKATILSLSLLIVTVFSCKKNTITEQEQEEFNLFPKEYQEQGELIAEGIIYNLEIIEKLKNDNRSNGIMDTIKITKEFLKDKTNEFLKLKNISLKEFNFEKKDIKLSKNQEVLIDDLKIIFEASGLTIEERKKMLEGKIKLIPEILDKEKRDIVYSVASFMYHYPFEEMKNFNKSKKLRIYEPPINWYQDSFHAAECINEEYPKHREVAFYMMATVLGGVPGAMISLIGMCIGWY